MLTLTTIKIKFDSTTRSLHRRYSGIFDYKSAKVVPGNYYFLSELCKELESSFQQELSECYYDLIIGEYEP